MTVISYISQEKLDSDFDKKQRCQRILNEFVKASRLCQVVFRATKRSIHTLCRVLG